MKNRATILLFSVTLALGVTALLSSSNDAEALEDFRSLFLLSTLYKVYELKHFLPSAIDQASLLYGGISLFAIIVIVLVLRAACCATSRAPWIY
jgi:hypothetical protein